MAGQLVFPQALRHVTSGRVPRGPTTG